ncbi:MAG: efflux RND transporter periplasmic adaptor subunit [Proteobacteria bacterium]|jgi:membrane fusion protein, multidrug efflux system|nr:efflux RND transporter periplasmic adaptor subunit [Pseudomonadota bacterium]MCG6936485.1 efflux RND transporter periplasmic adaptor subunit [Pseudomonadota bacterium]
MIKRLLLLLIVIVLIFGGLFGWKYLQIRQAMQSRKPPPPPVVAVTRVAQEKWQPYLSAVGSLTAVAGIDISNEIAGKVTAIHFESGNAATQGQLLIELDTSSDEAELDGLLANQRLAKIRFNRLTKLLSSKSVSVSDYDEANALLDEAKALVIAKRVQIDKKKIRAPFNGILGIRAVDVGQFLPVGSNIVSLQALDPIYVDFTLPERELSRLKPGQKVELTVQTYPDRQFSGQLTALNPGVEQNSRSIRVRATLENQDRLLRPGMFAQVQVLVGEPRTVLTLPDTAISYNPYGDSVFIVEPAKQGHLVQRKQIETGSARQGRVEIINGLQLDQQVVSAGQVKLRAGMPVTLDDKPAPGERNTP